MGALYSYIRRDSLAFGLSQSLALALKDINCDWIIACGRDGKVKSAIKFMKNVVSHIQTLLTVTIFPKLDVYSAPETHSIICLIHQL